MVRTTPVLFATASLSAFTCRCGYIRIRNSLKQSRVNLFSTQVPDFTYVTKIGNPLFSAISGQNKFTVLNSLPKKDIGI